MINLLWILVVAAAIFTQWYIIEELRKYPNKLVWAFLRLVVAGLFLFAYVQQGYVWYWAVNFMVFTFWFPFNVGLNLMRGKPIAYLSPKNSFVDRMLMKIFRYEFAVLAYAFVSFISAVGIMLYYGKCSWVYINAGLCL